MRISGGTVFGVTLLLAIAGLVFFFEFILAGVAFNGHINVTWVEREVFLEAYGIDAAAGERTAAADQLPSCFANIPTTPASFEASSARCGTFKVSRLPMEDAAGPQFNPVVIYDHQAREWPFTPYRIETLVLAAGPGKAGALPQALATARSLSPDEFGTRYAPNYRDPVQGYAQQEMLVWKDSSPEITAVDCGDYSLLSITLDPNWRSWQ